MSLHEDGMLWQLLKAYANEDWDSGAEPWPAPAEAFLNDASRAEAAQLAREMDILLRLDLDDEGWRKLLRAAHVDDADLGDDLTTWAQALADAARERAGAA